ncbi:hypothetical protein BP00DRAFT_420164 [Aspergillus indologenus CBS 114.80]|uniref:Thioester reductase (TE) domain-containing protein n=1 Tax=Aspergillus indologenus CBS 114.80 TaxID=1450541 RepID=A0A2V5HT82_9EURO|nr:hypothetical protein BP00DRAFT_420164 [Aspergillus indologenus CBS 114.80]
MDVNERHGAESDSVDRERRAIKHALESENVNYSRDAQIPEEMVILASPSKPFIRTGNGSVHRNKTLELYKTEIERVYGLNESPEPSNLDQTSLCLSFEHALARGLVNIIGKLESGLANLNVTTNIFGAGLDSKHAQILASFILKILDGRQSDWKDLDSVLKRYEVLNRIYNWTSVAPWRILSPTLQGSKVRSLLLTRQVKQWDPKTAVPETSLPYPEIAETGYGLSKVVAARLLDQAVQAASMRVSICWLGQVAGQIQDGRKGTGKARAWPIRDWFPTLLSSSVALGCLPDTLGSADQIDWLQVDTVADFLCNLISLSGNQHGHKNGRESEYFHLVNPNRVQYANLVSLLAARLGLLNPKLKVVPLSEWVTSLEEKENSTEPAAGIQLLSFFQGLADTSHQGSAILETTLTEKHLPRLKECPPINPKSIDKWLSQWEMTPASMSGYPGDKQD